jgi:YihY family inner membrane protein
MVSKNRLKTLWNKVSKDNVGTLAAIVAWNTLTSLVPIVIGLIAISGFILRGSPSMQHSVVTHLSAALKGVLTPADLNRMVHTTVNHAGLLGIIGFLGILWGGSNVGGAISTVFQAIFETGGRNFVKEKLLDVGMIIAMTVLMIVIVVGTTAGSIVHNLASNFPLSSVTTFVIGVAISTLAAFLLFAAIYLAFPNAQPRLTFPKVWRGALPAAVLFEALTFVWPLYAKFAHFNRYGAVLFPILVLTAWIYFFSVILVIGAEFVAIPALEQANRENVPIGPKTQGTVPQHEVLRQD